jgi:LAO/AO transport system kinase
LLGAAGIGVVIVETVGVGQMEVEIASAADTTAVVVTPGWGDSMQANKAGLLEVADVFVINKADRPGVREARRDLEQMLDLARPGVWRPEIVDTTATAAEGVSELWTAVARHRAHLLGTGRLTVRRADRLALELRRVLLARTEVHIDELVAGEEFNSSVKALVAGELDPYQAADRLLAD